METYSYTSEMEKYIHKDFQALHMMKGNIRSNEDYESFGIRKRVDELINLKLSVT